MEVWLSVIDYAVNKKISLSTLRRRIKAQALESRMENGKYLIKVEFEKDSADAAEKLSLAESAETVQNLITELKKAYGLVLTEKEELIQQLKSEIEILKHINQFLEQQILKEDQKEDQGRGDFIEPDLF